MSTDPNAPPPARAPASHTVAGRIRASMLMKIVSPLIGALVIGSVATAFFAGWLSGRPSPSRISASDPLTPRPIGEQAAATMTVSDIYSPTD